jgi:hypothetical protein
MKEKGNTNKISPGKPEEIKLLGRSGRSWVNDIINESCINKV